METSPFVTILKILIDKEIPTLREIPTKAVKRHKLATKFEEKEEKKEEDQRLKYILKDGKLTRKFNTEGLTKKQKKALYQRERRKRVFQDEAARKAYLEYRNAWQREDRRKKKLAKLGVIS